MVKTSQQQEILIIAFFRKLRINAKGLFYFFMACILIQLFLTLIKLSAAPFLLYGMFSAKETPGLIVKKEILFDSVSLSSARLSDRERYLLMSTMDHYISIKRNANIDIVQTRVENMYPFVMSYSFYPVMKDRIYNDPGDVAMFEKWYKAKAAEMLKSKVTTITVFENRYVLSADLSHLKLVSHEQLAFF